MYLSFIFIFHGVQNKSEMLEINRKFTFQIILPVTNISKNCFLSPYVLCNDD